MQVSRETRVAAAQAKQTSKLWIPLVVGGAVSILLGTYSQAHDPTGRTVYSLIFTGTINLKVWFATIAFLLSVFQLLSALRIYGKIKVPATYPSWLGDAHRLSGTLAFLFTLPVAYHCLWSIGFQSEGAGYSHRVWIHSVIGCLVYGAYATKVVAVRRHDLPSWLLPVMGGLLFTLLTVVWATSAAWWWTANEFPGF